MSKARRTSVRGLGLVLGLLAACGSASSSSTDDDVALPDRVEPQDAPTTTHDGAIADAPSGDAATDAPSADADSGPKSLRVFVSSTTTTGDIGGLGAADKKCAALAAKLGGSWVAWLSANGPVGPEAASRLTSAGPWRLPSGELVAASKAALLSGTLAHAIDHDESGAPVPASRVWTGTGPNGQYLTNDCDKWTTGTMGRVGLTTATDPSWTSASVVDACVQARRLYCFEL